MLKNSAYRLAVVSFVSVAALGAVMACSDDNKTAAPAAVDAGGKETGSDAPVGAATATVSGTVSYQGVKRNQAIYLVLFTTVPPDPNKIGGGTAVPMPMLPGTNPFTIKGVKAGMYYLAAEILPLVQGPPPPPEADTPMSSLVPVMVTEGQQVVLPNVVLTDPPADAGTDAPSDAPSDAPDAG